VLERSILVGQLFFSRHPIDIGSFFLEIGFGREFGLGIASVKFFDRREIFGRRHRFLCCRLILLLLVRDGALLTVERSVLLWHEIDGAHRSTVGDLRLRGCFDRERVAIRFLDGRRNGLRLIGRSRGIFLITIGLRNNSLGRLRRCLFLLGGERRGSSIGRDIDDGARSGLAGEWTLVVDRMCRGAIDRPAALAGRGLSGDLRTKRLELLDAGSSIPVAEHIDRLRTLPERQKRLGQNDISGHMLRIIDQAHLADLDRLFGAAGCEMFLGFESKKGSRPHGAQPSISGRGQHGEKLQRPVEGAKP
jgi:hypothetical protein